MVYVVVVRVVAVVGTFEAVSPAAAAAVSALLLTLLFPHVVDLQDWIYHQDVFAFVFLIVRVCAAAAAEAAVVLYSLRFFPHRGRCLPSLLLLLFTWYAVGGGAVAVPARSRPVALNPRQKMCYY